MKSSRNDERGQTLVIVALAMIPILLVVGLVIDGGWAFTQQRHTQNAMDSAANAGAVTLVQNLPFRVLAQTQPKTDSDVLASIVTTAALNGVSSPAPTAVYTDQLGAQLSPGVVVGSLGAVPPPAGAYGVQVTGSTSFSTFFAGIAGMTGFKATALATAVAGSINSICSSDEPCNFIPVTFPTALTDCENTNKQTAWGSGGPYALTDNPQASNEIIIPLCGSANGSVGWLDLQPHNPGCNGNGAAELACNIATPNHSSYPLPIWMETQTGNTNSSLVQNALNGYTGPTVGLYEPGLDKTVTIPLYDCIDNRIGQVSPGPACPNPKVTGVGNNTSYHVVALGAMILDKAYIQSNNPECNQTPGGPPAGGNGATGCLKGWLTQIVTTGQVGLPGSTMGTIWGVQLIR